MGHVARTRPLKVCHLLSSFGTGGQERVALDLCVGLRDAGLHVHTLAFADGPLRESFTATGISTDVINKRDGRDLRAPFLLWHTLRGLRPDIVHTHNPQALIYGVPAARSIGAKVVHTKHGLNPGATRELALRRIAAMGVARYVAVSHVTAEAARRQREVAERKLVTIENGIDLDRFATNRETRQKIRQLLGFGASDWVVGTVGRLAKEKNQRALIAAMAPQLSATRHLVVVGDGPELGALQASRSALGDAAKYVHLLGARTDIPALLAAFDVFALSSLTEGLPLVIIEAMAASLPVVSTAVGGIPSVIENGVTGFLAATAADLAPALERLATDPDAARAMGAAGKKLAHATYSRERMVGQYQSVYAAALRRAEK